MIYPKKYFKYLSKFKPGFKFRFTINPYSKFTVVSNPFYKRGMRYFQMCVNVETEGIIGPVELFPRIRYSHPHKLMYD